MTFPRIGLTVGDPAGIGPEITEKAAADRRVLEVCRPVVYGPSCDEARTDYEPGVGSADGGRLAFKLIRQAVNDARNGRIEAVVTAPINKAVWAQAGLSWRGHTDLLAELTGSTNVAMMFDADPLRVVLATVHIPLVEVPRLLTRERVEETIALTHAEMPNFGIARPRIGLAGLNPHAGEDGVLGIEEGLVLEPAITSCRKKGIDVSGPFPGDTVFLRAKDNEFDVVVACYHDQGLIPIKLMAFGRAVNVTLGLPIVRTSVDHGTAYDIAGKGTADHSSMVEAVLLAARLVARRTPVKHD